MHTNLLLIDIGNTTVKGWDTNTFYHWQSPQQLYEFLSAMKPFVVFLDVRRDEKWREVLRSFLHFELDAHTPWPIPSHYKASLGVDRKAAIFFAHRKGNFPCLVICAGTAITYDYIDAQGIHQGGAISPGMHLRFDVLHEKTGQLPRVDVGSWIENWATDTHTALQKGVQQGLLYEIKGFIQQTQPAHVYLTGGEGKYIATWLPHITFVPDLIFQGMRLWYENISH